MLRIYRMYLARHLIFRLLKASALIAYRSIHRFRSFVLPSSITVPYVIAQWSNFRDPEVINRFTFEPARSIDIPPPRFASTWHSVRPHAAGNLKIEMPKLEVVEFRGAIVVGATDFIVAGQTAIFPDAFNPENDTCPAEVFGIASINRDRNTLRLYLTQEPKQVEMAVTLLGQNTSNYAHWLSEILPKLVILDTFSEFDRTPLLLDHGLHPNIYESIRTLNTKGREIIPVERWRPVQLDRLVSISHPAYEPYVPHALSKNGSSKIINAFSRPALKALREEACRATETTETRWPLGTKRIYIRRSRKSENARRVINSDLIERFLEKRNFKVLEPASMNFSGQVAACKEAEFIIAPVGAALANMIFSPPGCKIIALAPYYDDANYYYYSNLAGVLEHELYYVLGRQIENAGHPMHRDYSIDLSELEKAIDLLLGISCSSSQYAALN